MTYDDRTRRLREITRDIVGTYQTIGGINRIGEKNLPSQQVIVDILEQLLAVVFWPESSSEPWCIASAAKASATGSGP
jgi:hypothetical protein